MTISTTTSRVSYAGNGVTTIFSFPYRFLANGDLEVTLFDAAGTPDPQILTTDYTVLGADNDAGGSVTMLVAPAVGETLVIRRVVELTQETDYISGDSFPAETHERALDRLTMIDQQLQEQIDRSITLPLDDDAFSGALPAIVPSRFLRVNDSGTAFELVDVLETGELVVSPFVETLLDDANAAAARTTLAAAGSGANSDITSLAGLTTPLPRGQGGTGAVYTTNASLFEGIKQAASDTATGVVELATAAEFNTGADTGRVPPVNVIRANQVVAIAAQAASGTSVDFTAIPAWVNRITVLFAGVSTNGSATVRVQIGDAGGIENIGYTGAGQNSNNAPAAIADGFPVEGGGGASAVRDGSVVLERVTGTNTWIARAGMSAGSIPTFGFGGKTLSAALDRVRITANGTDAFDAGSFSLLLG